MTEDYLDGALILLIEDEEMVADVLILRFEMWGCQVQAFSDGEKAVAAAPSMERCPDLIVSDFRLPGRFNGVQAMNRLRRALGQKVPGLLLTGGASDEVTVEARAHGYKLLHKPTKALDLKNALIEELGLKDARSRAVT